MPLVQDTLPKLTRVSKLHRHRRHRSLQTHKRRYASTARNQPKVIVHTKIHSSLKIHPKDNDKISPVAFANDPSHEVKIIDSRMSNAESTATKRFVVITKVRRYHSSVAPESNENERKNDTSNNECSSDLEIAREDMNTSIEDIPVSPTQKRSSLPSAKSHLDPSESNVDLSNRNSQITASRMGFTGDIRDIIHRKKRERRQRCLGANGCPCSRLCAFFLCLLGCLLGGTAITALLVGLLIKSTTTTTTSTIASSTVKSSVFNVNLLTNGDGETGPCETSTLVTSPTGWNYNGTITQIYYNNTAVTDQNLTSPGPNDRGQCYFYGQISASTSMWQTINLINYVDPLLIDAQTVKFNLSAWIGGYFNQDDNAIVSLTFADQGNQTVGNGSSIGPVLAADRGNQTSLLFRQTNGLVPVTARYSTVLVTITRLVGTRNDGNIDNIAVTLYQ